MKIAVTGHRPPKLGGHTNKDRVEEFAALKVHKLTKKIEDEHPDLYFVVGGALGWDQSVALACFNAGIPYEFHLPSPDISSRWPKEATQHFNILFRGARNVKYLVPDRTLSPSNYTSALKARNRTIVNGCGYVLALWDGKKDGGTFDALQYAASLHPKPTILNTWESWLEFNPSSPHIDDTLHPEYRRPRLNDTGTYS